MYIDIITGADTKEGVFEIYHQSKKIFRMPLLIWEILYQLHVLAAENWSHGEVTTGVRTRGTSSSHKSDAVLGKDISTIPLEKSHHQQHMKSRFWVYVGDWQTICWCLTCLGSANLLTAGNRQSAMWSVRTVLRSSWISFSCDYRIQIFFQCLCNHKLDWDRPLPMELSQQWNRLIDQLRWGIPISLPRSYSHSASDEIASQHLRGFCNASSRAYAVIVYLASVTTSSVQVSFMASKTRYLPHNHWPYHGLSYYQLYYLHISSLLWQTVSALCFRNWM